MNIYELTKDGEPSELKTTGHIDAFEFAQKVKSEFDLDINIGDVKQSWERMCFKRNRNPTKPGHTIFKRCTCSDFGAKPVTFVKVEK